MPRSSTCIVYGCNNKLGKFRLPSNESMRARWIKAAKLDTHPRSFGKGTRICLDHFKSSDFYQTFQFFDGDVPTLKLRPDSVPSIFPWTSKESSSEYEVKFKPQLLNTDYSRKILPTTFVIEPTFIKLESTHTIDPLDTCNGAQTTNEESDSICAEQVSKFDIELKSEVLDIEYSPTEFVVDKPFIQIKSINRTEDSLDVCNGAQLMTRDDSISGEMVIDDVRSLTTTSTSVKSSQTLLSYDSATQKNRNATAQTTKKVLIFSVDNYRYNDNAIQFYTGLESFKKMQLVFRSLGADVHKLKYSNGSPPPLMDSFEQFFLTLIILRRHMTIRELSMLYLIPSKRIAYVFTTWIKFMANKWRTLNLWICEETVKAFMPLDFKDDFPQMVDTDTTECSIRKPGHKNKATVKFMYGVAPNGLITYVSPCYAGFSDSRILERCEILNSIVPNDEQMVDINLINVKIFVPYVEEIDMPAFLNKCKVSRKRIHVQKTIGLLKTYKIMTQPLNDTEIRLSSDIVFVCVMLTNFRTNLINENAVII